MRPLPTWLLALASAAAAVMLMGATNIAGWLGQGSSGPKTGIESTMEDFRVELNSTVVENPDPTDILGFVITSVDLGYEFVVTILDLPSVLSNLGVPYRVAVPLSIPVYIVATIWLIRVLRGTGG